MTAEQNDTVKLLRQRHYSVTIKRHARGGVLLVQIACRLRKGIMPLRIYPTGEYICPWYDLTTPYQRKRAPWLNSSS